MKKNKNLYIGIDIGGTKIALGVINKEGKIFFCKIYKASELKNKKQLINFLISAINEAKKRFPSKIKAVGFAVHGLIDPMRTVSLAPPNLKSLKGLNFRKDIGRVCKLPVFIGNDLWMFALGEKVFGAGKNVDNMMGIPIGTGIGCGLIINGKLYRGASYNAGELGHNIIVKNGKKCGCGNYGCLETLVGGKYLGDPAKIFKLARAGNKKARKIVDDFIENLSLGVSHAVNVLNPEMIVFGGSVGSGGWPLFKNQLKVEIKNKTFVKMPKIIKSKLGNRAQILGAGYLAYLRINNQ